MKNKYIFLIKVFFITIFFYFQTLNLIYSTEPDEILNNIEHEERARKISMNVRCLVCQNQSIDDSSAPLAKDLRILIRDKISEGYTDKQIYDFLSDRYGDFIFLKPPFKLSTLGLWFLPFIFLLLGIYIIYLHNKRSKKVKY